MLFSQLQSVRRLTQQSLAPVVYRYTPQRHPLDRTDYVPYYVERPNMYHRDRKPRLSQWDDPAVQWPKLLPQATKETGRQLMLELEQEQIEKIRYKRNFELPKIKAGDVVNFTMLHSLSEQKGNNYTGLCIGTKRMNSLNATFRALIRYCGCMVEMDIKVYSPLLSDLKLVAKGSPAHQKRKMYWLADLELTKEQLQSPIVKNSKKRKNKQKA